MQARLMERAQVEAKREKEKGRIKDLAKGKGAEKERWPGQGREHVASTVTTHSGCPGTEFEDFQNQIQGGTGLTRMSWSAKRYHGTQGC